MSMVWREDAAQTAQTPKVLHPSCNVDAFALAFSKALGHKRQNATTKSENDVPQA